MKSNINLLEPGKRYHVYNRGINGENLFKEERNYSFFLQKYMQYVEPVAKTYAYCLLKNHFHLLVEIRSMEEMKTNFLAPGQTPEYQSKFQDEYSLGLFAGRQFGHLFNSYTQSINKAHKRTGGLFEEPFRRIPVETDSYFSGLIWYIHYNPQKHKFVTDFKEYIHSSYQIHLSDNPTKLEREALLNWFGGKEGYLEYHNSQHNISDMEEGF